MISAHSPWSPMMHYYTAPSAMTDGAWAAICADVATILKRTATVRRVPITAPRSSRSSACGTGPEITDEHVAFTVGETDIFIARAAESSSDCLRDDHGGPRLVATAVLAAIDSLHGYSVGSSGDGRDWLAGVREARRALPQHAHRIDIPMKIMKADRWIDRLFELLHGDGYALGYCIDGRAYLFDARNPSRSYCFPTHEEARAWADQFDPSKAKSASERSKLSHQRRRIVDSAHEVGRFKRPPAYARARVVRRHFFEDAPPLSKQFEIVEEPLTVSMADIQAATNN